MLTSVFINLPVENLEKSKAFFSQLGFKFNPDFTNDESACMIINDKTFVMLSIHEKFQGFIKTPIADKNTTEAILSFACETKDEVETIATKAFAAGGKQVNDLEDHGMMVSWGFEDLDGHLWDLFWMDPEHIAKLTNTKH